MDIEFLKDAVRDLVNDASGATVDRVQVKVDRILKGLDDQKVHRSSMADRLRADMDRVHALEEELQKLKQTAQQWADTAAKQTNLVSRLSNDVSVQRDRANKAEGKLASTIEALERQQDGSAFLDKIFGTVPPTESDLRLHNLRKVYGELLQRAAIGPNGQKILDECLSLASMLIEKNIAYGNSALNPVRIFARDLDPKAQILVRLDDKLSRLARGSAAGEDVILDLLGYLILYRISDATVAAPEKNQQRSSDRENTGGAVRAESDRIKAALDNIKVRAPTPEEVEKLKAAAEESEKNSPYQPNKKPYFGIQTFLTGVNGLQVLQVDHNSPAMVAGVHPDDRIMSANGVALHTFDQLVEIVDKGGPNVPLILEISRDDKIVLLHVLPGVLP